MNPGGKSRTALGAAALSLALAACSEGCASQPLPVSDPSFAAEGMTLAQLEERLWPREQGLWRPLAEYQLFALERLVAGLIGDAQRGGLSRGGQRRVARLAEIAGLELHIVELELDAGVRESVWLLLEPEDDRRGRGTYLIRVGELGGERGRPPELLLQAPHSRFDKYTGSVALALFFARPPGRARPRALFVNDLHRYAQYDGTRDKQDEPGSNPADAAHQPDHPMARATQHSLDKHDLAVVQLHGFGRQAESGDPDIIVGSGQSKPHAASVAALEGLRAAFPELAMGHYGVDTDRLGGTTNVQGQAAREAKRCFVHLETSETVRELLHEDAAARERFAKAVFARGGKEFRRGCR